MKNALIIGATSGIGLELSKLLVAENYKVVITGRRKELLHQIQETNPDQYIVKVQDVTNIESCDLLFDELKKELKVIDLIVYSSGVGKANYKLNWEEELPTLETNVIAATKIYGLAFNFFREQGFGHLVGISSVASIRGNRHAPGYFASKAFQASYLESLWMKGKRSKANIWVTDIQPGFVDTPMALGATFWMSSATKAAKQIYSAIKRKKRRVYITKRWALVAFVMKIVPTRILMRFTT